MSEQNFKIARNTSYYTLALVLQKVISFVYFSYIAVKIGAGDLGNYTFALFFTTIFAVIIDIGLSNVLIREVSKDQAKSQHYLASALSIKLPLAVLTYAVVVILINLIESNVLVRQLVYLAGIIMVLDSFTLTFYAFLRGHHNLKFESLGTIIFQVILAALGFVIISLTHDLRILILAILAASLFNLIYSAILIKAKLKLKFTAKPQRWLIKSLLILTIPFALAAIFTRVYGYIDTVLLKQLVDETALGYYSIPYKITFSLQFIPMAFVASLYPAFASYFINSRELLKKTFEKSMVYLGMLAIPVTLGVIALAKPLMIKVYTNQFSPSILPLQILILSLVFLFLNFPLGSLLNACNRQTRNTVHIGVVMVINIILNFILIPKFSYLGAAIASSISTLIMFILQMYAARQIISYSFKFLVDNFLRILVSGLIMFLAIIYLETFVNFIILIPVGVVIYTGILYLLKGFTKNDIQLIYQGFFKR
ncbi:flippase [Patescibacteria group bacterium]|nr:flippase [Patescibacteria group bacterium]